MKKIFIILLVFICACKKQDNGPKVIDGGSAKPLQVVKLNLTGFALAQSEYQGTLGSYPVTILRGLDNYVYFGVPAECQPGTTKLTIEGVNADINFNILPGITIDNPDLVIQDLQQRATDYCSTANASDTAIQPVFDALNSFNQTYQNATPSAKIKMAQYYSANSEAFNAILGVNFSARFSGTVKSKLIDIYANIMISIVSAHTALYSPEPELKIIAAVVAVASGPKVARDLTLILLEQPIFTMNTVIAGLVGEVNRSTSLELNDNTLNTFSFSTKDRTFISSDNGSSNPGTALFFQNGSKFNEIANKINPVLSWLNNNIPFCNFSLLPLLIYPSQGTEANTSVENTTFSNYHFFISDPNLELQQVTFAGNGQIGIKVKVLNSSASFPVASQLKYTYSDEYSSFSGQFPLIVNQSYSGMYSLISWTHDGVNWLNPGTYVNGPLGNCGQLMDAYSYLSGYVNLLNDGTFTYQNMGSLLRYNFIATPDTTDDPCNLLDQPDSYHPDQESGSGTYTITGPGQLNFFINSNPQPVPVTVVNGTLALTAFIYRKQ